MPHKDPEVRKEWYKKWHEKNKEERNKKAKEWYKNITEEQKEHRKEVRKEYDKTEQGKKTRRINVWKSHGIKSEDYEELYEIFINTIKCEECDIELTYGSKGNTRKCLDHDHKTGLFRNVLCHSCNVKRR